MGACPQTPKRSYGPRSVLNLTPSCSGTHFVPEQLVTDKDRYEIACRSSPLHLYSQMFFPMDTRMKLYSNVLSVLICLTWSGAFMLLAVPLSAQRTPPIEISFDTFGDGKSPLVNARINGRLATRFVFDTGANTCIITDKLVAQLGLTPTPAVMSNGKPFCDVDGKQFQAVTLTVQIGDWQREGPFMVLPEKRIPLAQEKSIGGLLGANILFDSSAYFDFEHQKIKVYDRRSPSEEDIKALGMSEAVCLPLLKADKFTPAVHVRFREGVELDMLLDTGAAATFLSSSVVSQLHLKSSRKSSAAPTLYGTLHKYTAIVPQMWFGPLLLRNLEADWAKDAPSFFISHIGTDAMSQFLMLIDYPAHKLYLKPTVEFAIKPEALQATNAPTVATMPLEYIERTQAPFVRLTLQDGKPYLFQLDTGATTSYFDRSLTEQAKFPVEDAKDEVGHTIAAFRATLRLSPQVSPVAAVPEMPVPLIVQDLTDWRAGFPGAAGILGINVLAQVPWQFDFGRKQVTFFLPGDRPGTLPKPKAALRLPLHSENGLLYVEGEVDGTKTRFLLSTSQNTQLRSPTTLAALKPLGRLEFTDDVAATVMPEGKARLHEMRVGNLTWKEPVVAVQAGEKATQPDILGLDFLYQYRITIDVPSHSLYLQPDPAYKAVSDTIVNIGVTPRVTAEKAVVVNYLILHSPAAEAGLQVGDTILSVNGIQATSEATYAQLVALLRSPVGTELTLSIRRKGEDKPREVKMKTRKLL